MQSLLLFDASFSFILDFVNNNNSVKAKQLAIKFREIDHSLGQAQLFCGLKGMY